jgi:hypothetical protein
VASKRGGSSVLSGSGSGDKRDNGDRFMLDWNCIYLL